MNLKKWLYNTTNIDVQDFAKDVSANQYANRIQKERSATGRTRTSGTHAGKLANNTSQVVPVRRAHANTADTANITSQVLPAHANTAAGPRTKTGISALRLNARVQSAARRATSPAYAYHSVILIFRLDVTSALT